MGRSIGRWVGVLFMAAMATPSMGAAAQVYQVGPGRAYPTLASLPALSPGDLVEVYPGTYNETKRWTNAGTASAPIVIRGMGSPRPVIDASGKNVSGSLPNPRAAFQVEAGNVVIENFEFRNARNAANGAGVRVTGFSGTTLNVVLRNLKVSACDMGLQNDTSDNLLIESCEVFGNGTSQRDGMSHNLYLGGNKTTIQYCWIYGSTNGLNFKTRGHYTELLYNFIADSQDGEVDLVDDAATEAANSHVLMVGNVIVSKPRLSGYNSARFIHMGQDSGADHRGTLYLFNNTLVAGDSRIQFLSLNAPGSSIVARNNLFTGSGSLGSGAISGSNNWVPTGMTVPGGFAASTGSVPGFVNAAGRDYHLTPTSPCRNIGTASLAYLDGTGASRVGTPTREYVHPLQSAARAADSTLDAGAYESGSGGGPLAPTITQQPANQNVTAGQTATFTVTATGTAPLAFQWQRNGSTIGGATASSYTTPVTTTSDAGATFRVVVSNSAGTVTSDSATLMVTPAGVALPSPWQHLDLGRVGLAGSAGFSSGVFTVTGSGADIWGTADGLHFVYQPMTGDGTLTSRVSGQENTDPWAKAGVMIRETLAPGSTFSAMVLTPGNGTSFLGRTSTDGPATSVSGPSQSWVRLSRSGSIFTGSVSPDGVSWTPVGTLTIPMAATAYMGLAVTSHNDADASTATFESVSTEGTPPASGKKTGGGGGGGCGLLGLEAAALLWGLRITFRRVR